MKKTIVYFIFFLTFCFCRFNSSAQQNSIDSLITLLKNTTNDTLKLNILVQLSEECEPAEILKHSTSAIDMADKLIQQDVIKKNEVRKMILSKKALALTNIGVYYNGIGDPIMALDYYNRGLKIQEDIQDKKGIAESLNNIGVIYNYQGDIPKALIYYGKALRIQEEIGDKKNIATALHNIGLIYKNQGDLNKALIYYTKSLKIREEIGNKQGIAVTLNNLGVIYNNIGNLDKALECYQKSMVINESLGNKSSVANTLNNVGNLYNKKGLLKNALDCFFNSISLLKEFGDKRVLSYTLNDISLVYLKQKKYDLAYQFSDSSLRLSKKLGYPDIIRNAENFLSKIDSAKGNFLGAFEHYKQFIIYRDSLNNEITRKASIKSQLNYEFEKKEAVIKEQQEKERVIAKEKDSFQKIVIWSVICGFLMVAAFAALIFRTLKTTRKQKLIIEKKQNEILASIRYAKRIQTSLLPSEKYIERNLKQF